MPVNLANLFWFMLATCAAYRVAYMISMESGPFRSMETARGWVFTRFPPRQRRIRDTHRIVAMGRHQLPTLCVVLVEHSIRCACELGWFYRAACASMAGYGRFDFDYP